MAPRSLTDLPLEILQSILGFLDVHALLQTSRTSRQLRTLSIDPLLRRIRLNHARHDLNILLLHRLPRSSISPPNALIWLSKTNVLSRSISKSLIRIRLNHSLERRPSVDELIERAILPECCARVCVGVISPAIVGKQEDVRKLRLKNKLGRLLQHRPTVDRIVEMNILPAECGSGSKVSPRLSETRRKVVRERLKDELRTWVKKTALEEQRRKEEEYERGIGSTTVNSIIRRFSAWKAAAELENAVDQVSLEKKAAQTRWGKALEDAKRKEEKRMAAVGTCSQPTRAHVLALRKFWEGTIKAAVI